MNLHYFKASHLSQGFTALFTGRMLQHLGYSLIGLFLPIYMLLKYDRQVEYVFYFFLLGYLLYALFLPLGVKAMNHIGMKRSLQLSVFFFAGYYVCLYFLERDPILFSILATIVITIGRTMFWLPFSVDLAKFTDKSNRGKGISLMWASNTTLSVLMPVVSGFLLMKYDYDLIFILAIFIYLTSSIPYLTLPHTHERYTWGYFQTWKKFFSRENRKLVLSNMANGAESAVGMIVWPIFIWQLLEGNYAAVGGISSLIVLVTVIMQFIVGGYTDKIDKRKMIHWGSVFYALGWVGKIFVLTSLQIFVVGAYHNLAKIFKDTPFDALTYELMADHGHFVDEYTALKEVSVQLGRVVILVFAIVVVSSLGLNWAFALAALASLFVNVL